MAALSACAAGSALHLVSPLQMAEIVDREKCFNNTGAMGEFAFEVEHFYWVSFYSVVGLSLRQWVECISTNEHVLSRKNRTGIRLFFYIFFANWSSACHGNGRYFSAAFR